MALTTTMECLFEAASEQMGYFTTQQARACGFALNTLTYHTRTGRFRRVRRGLYRLRDYPSAPREEVMAAWLAIGKQASVVSHDSALDLLDLSDIIPDAIHLTVPRSRRHLSPIEGVTIHTSTRPIQTGDTTVVDGIRLTSATRTILDAADAGMSSEHVEHAIQQALKLGMTSPQRLRNGANVYGQRVTQIVDDAIQRYAR